MFAFFHLNLQVLAVTYWPLFQWRTGTSRNWGLHRGRSFLVATIGPQKLGTEPIDTKIWEKHACVYNFVCIILYNIYIYYNSNNAKQHQAWMLSAESQQVWCILNIWTYWWPYKSAQLEGPFGGGPMVEMLSSLFLDISGISLVRGR